MLDVIGDAEKLGKAVGVDAQKNTFVRLYGINACQERIESETQAACAALYCFKNAELLRDLAQHLAKRDH